MHENAFDIRRLQLIKTFHVIKKRNYYALETDKFARNYKHAIKAINIDHDSQRMPRRNIFCNKRITLDLE